MIILIPRLRIQDMTVTNSNSKIQMSNARVTNYKPPDVQKITLQPPHQIQMFMHNMNVAISGHAVGTGTGLFSKVSGQGDFDAQANNVDVTYNIKILRQSNGQFNIQTAGCQAQVGNCDINIYNTGPLGKFVQGMKPMIIKQMKPQLEKEICDQGTRYFDQGVNKYLSALSTKFYLNETDPERFAHNLLHPNDAQNQNQQAPIRGPTTRRPPGSQNSNDDFKKMIDSTSNITKHLMLDYQNVKDPQETKDYLETYNKGEISYQGQGQTPFSPNDLREPTPYPTQRMAYLIASDYVANSMLYQSFTHQLLKYRINAQETPDLAQYLQTTCGGDILSGDMCLGSIVPQIQETFPNSQAEILIEANQLAPAVFFQKDGQVRMQAPITLTINAKKGQDRKLMAIADSNVTARTKLYVDQEQKIKGNLTMDKIDIKMKTNNIKNFNQKDLDDLAKTAKNLMETMGNTYLSKGIPLPVCHGMQLKNTQVNVYERTIRIDSDCQVDQATLSKMAAKAIRENGQGARVEGIDEN